MTNASAGQRWLTAVRRGGWIVVAIALALAITWWVLSPDALDGYGNGLGDRRAGPVEHIGSDISTRADRSATITDIRPRLTLPEGPSEVFFRYTMCRGQQASYGLHRGPRLPAAFCPDPQPVIGATLSPLSSVVATITTCRPVRVVVDGFDVSYRDGIRFGDQHTGIRIELRPDAEKWRRPLPQVCR